jgi:transcriptional regulator GlxA family with amidase domain
MKKIDRLGIVLFPGTEELDFCGPWEMFTMWRDVAEGPRECLIVAETLEPVRCAKGLRVLPDVDFAGSGPLDAVLMPGGRGTREQVNNPVLLDWLRAQAPGCEAVMSVCTGSFVLHAAGLLAGKRATTYWASLGRMRALGDVKVVEERWVREGRLWCSAGVSAGMEMALAVIADHAGAEVAGKVQLGAEFYPEGRLYGTAHHHAQAPAYVKALSA